MPDEVSAEWAANILKQKHERPFFLAVGFIRPHTPLFAPKKYFDMFPPESITLPPYLKNDLDDCAQALRNRWSWGYQKFDGLTKAGGEKAWKEWVRAYLANVAFVDAQVGVVLDALNASAYADNTIVVFTSDHGYHVGEKDVIQKWHLWDESTRVPLLIHVPQGKGNGKRCQHPVSSLDIYPTLADLCGLSLEPNKGGSGTPLDGHSLRPFLEKPKRRKWDGPSVTYMSVGVSFQDKEGWDIGPHHSVRSHHFRYTLCSNGEEELYDHREDPNEWNNLAADIQYTNTKQTLREQLESIPGVKQ
jgi:arylsulfatase A-like enzyme